MNIDGLCSTKDAVVIDAVSDLFKVQNYSDLVQRTKQVKFGCQQNTTFFLTCSVIVFNLNSSIYVLYQVHARMKKLGCFSSVNVYLDTIDKTGQKSDLVS